jgi:hypothetical protein
MVRIGDATIAPTRKGADFRLVAYREMGLELANPKGERPLGDALPFDLIVGQAGSSDLAMWVQPHRPHMIPEADMDASNRDVVSGRHGVR